jgi:hypothetical protein
MSAERIDYQRRANCKRRALDGAALDEHLNYTFVGSVDAYVACWRMPVPA